MRVFLDTQVLIAAFTTRGLCVDLLRLVLTRYQLVTAKPVFRELRRVLTTRLGLPAALADQILPFLRELAEVANPTEPAARQAAGAHGRWMLDAALAAAADILVTTDPVLLRLTDDMPLRITDPRGFWDLIRSSDRQQRTG